MAEINTSEGVAVDSKGNVFIADTNSSCVREINASNGVISIVAGTGIAGYTGSGDTTVAAVSNNETLYAATTIAAASNNAKLNAATTIAAASNGKVLPQATITVASTAGFATSGTILVTTSTGVQTVTYTGTTATTFTGCTGGTGTMAPVAQSRPVRHPSTSYRQPDSPLRDHRGNAPRRHANPDLHRNHRHQFIGCSGGTGTMSTGGSVTANSSPSPRRSDLPPPGPSRRTPTPMRGPNRDLHGNHRDTFIGCTGGTGTLNT